MRPSRRVRPARDDGSILVLTLGFVVLALLLVVVVVDASVLFLAKRALASAADGASLAAAQALDANRAYQGGVGAQLPLSDVQSAVSRYETERGGGEQLSAQLADPTTVVVMGRRQVQLLFARALGIGAVTVTAQARASAVQLQHTGSDATGR